jgi:hypothetical protein
MASLMKAVDAIQKVQILPRATARHQPGSVTRWREETTVRSRGSKSAGSVGRLESCVKVVDPHGITTPSGVGTADSLKPLERRIGSGGSGETGQRPPGSETRAC